MKVPRDLSGKKVATLLARHYEYRSQKFTNDPGPNHGARSQFL